MFSENLKNTADQLLKEASCSLLLVASLPENLFDSALKINTNLAYIRVENTQESKNKRYERLKMPGLELVNRNRTLEQEIEDLNTLIEEQKISYDAQKKSTKLSYDKVIENIEKMHQTEVLKYIKTIENLEKRLAELEKAPAKEQKQENHTKIERDGPPDNLSLSFFSSGL